MDKEEALKKKRIFVGFNNAGAPGISSFTRVLRSQGLKVDFWGFTDKWRDVTVDVRIRRPKNIFLQKAFGVLLLVRAVLKYDVFHFYSCYTFFHYRVDHIVLKILGKKIVNTFTGSDVFDIGGSVKKYGAGSPYNNFYKKQGASFINWLNRRKEFIVSHSDRITLMGPWLVRSVARYDAVIPYPRNIGSIRSYKSAVTTKKKFLIFHAPTNEDIKGTRYLAKTVKSLKNKGYNVELKLTKNISREELLRELNLSDVVVDQLLIGWYGGFAVEAMALEKPVICFIKEEYKKLVPFGDEIPIINANKDDLEDVLEDIIKNKEKLSNIGKKGYEFVKKYHDAPVIAEQYKKVYESLV
ncbi:MAG: glycosyltransferase [Candidatus Woykebacteria bacterium]